MVETPLYDQLRPTQRKKSLRLGSKIKTMKIHMILKMLFQNSLGPLGTHRDLFGIPFGPLEAPLGSPWGSLGTPSEEAEARLIGGRRPTYRRPKADLKEAE